MKRDARRPRWRSNQGFALVTALVVIALTMAAGALLAASLHYRMQLLSDEVRDVHLTALTDAGLAFALDRLSLSHFWNGAGEQPLGDGVFAVEVEMGADPMTRVVTVDAWWGRGHRAARAVVQLSDYFPPRVVDWRPAIYDDP